METYHASARFILTCNYPNRVIPALHSRCQGFHIEKVDKTEFTARIATVLVAENVELDIETLDTYVRSTYPDLRKCLNLCQMNSTDGKLTNVKGDEGNTSDWRVDAVNLFKAGKIIEARKLMCATVRPEEMEDVFRWMYDNLELFSTTPEGQDSAIMAIRTGLVNHSFVADPEINLSATMVELSQING
jgi:DNA polymerase III delta prime subunit